MSQFSLAEAYDRVYLDEEIKFVDYSISYFPKIRSEVLIKFAGSGKQILDIGCGDGNVLYNLRNRFQKLYGVDISPELVQKLNEKVTELDLPMQFSVGNVETRLDFPDGFFDVILWADVIEHVVDVWSAMNEVKRLLAPGGTLVTCTPNIAEIRRRIALLAGRFPSTCGRNQGLDVEWSEMFDGGHLHYFTFSSLAELYKRYDIQPVQSIGFGRLGRLHNIYPSLLSNGICLIGTKREATS